MCDCFHMMMPTWPGAPGSVSGRQLQPGEPDAETEEDHSVTDEPADEIIRPRPQGSSPVYECVTEGAGFALPGTPSRPGSSGRRRSWWKRDSGDSRTFSRMSRSEEVTEVTLETQVEAGASGYSVSGGREEGIFVKQVLKGSSAAKLFSLREGDQLLSATIFFDDINYEDALKILQYSEPYKVQFKIRRKLPASGEEDWASRAALHAPKRTGRQDKAVSDGTTDTPTKTQERDGDEERLISKPREGRGRRPQKERLSWPKFQAIKGKRGPRRSHSSSEAYERGRAPDVSPTSSDTEAQLQAEEEEQKAGAGSGRRRRFLNLRFKMDSEDKNKEETKTQTQQIKLTAGRKKGKEMETDRGMVEKEVAGPDGKFKMPKFKMPSFGVSGPGKPVEASVDVSLPKVRTDVSLPSAQADVKSGDLSEELPSADLDVKTGELGVRLPESHMPEAELQGTSARAGLKGHLPTMHMPSMKMPKIDLKGPQVDIKGPKVDVNGARGEVAVPYVEVSLPSVEVDLQAPGAKLEADLGLGDKEVAARDGKFKMPKFKMPSFGVSVPGKDLGTSVDVPVPKATGEATLPSLAGEVRAPEASVHLPSADIQLPGGKLEGAVPEGEVTLGELKGKADGARFKGHLPKVQMPSMKMPKIDLKGPQVDIKGPKVDVKGARGEVSAPDLEVSLPSVEVDLQAPDAKLEADLGLAETEVAGPDGKFKMPKFKMPSFGVSGPGKPVEASVDVSLPKVRADVSLPSAQADIKFGDLSVELPSADLDVKTGELGVRLPEGHVPEAELQEPSARAGLKGHLPTMHMPSMKMPKIDLKGPQVDIKRPKVDMKGTRGEVTAPNVEVSLPSVEVDLQTPGAKLESDLGLGDKEVAARHGKFKMPKFKMPSFGVSGPGKPVEASVDVSLPKVRTDVSLPSAQADVKSGDVSVELPSAALDVKTGELGVRLPEGHVPEAEIQGLSARAGLKGYLPTIHMPSMKMPKIDLKGPQVDIKGPKVDVKGARGEVTVPDVEVSLPSVGVDLQAPGAKLEADLGLGYKEVAARDGKFKMPKFKMPSFGVSVPGKDLGTSVDVPVPKATGEATLPSLAGEVRAPEASVHLPSADIQLPGGKLEGAVPEGEVTLGELKGKADGARFKGHLPKVQMPSMKMPKIDLKGPQVDIKGPKVDVKGARGEVSAPDLEVSLPSVEVDIQALDAKLEADLGLAETNVAGPDGKFKMPKFKMPSFGVSGPGKPVEASVDVSLPKVRTDVALPSAQADVKSGDLGVELPSADLDVKTGELGVRLPEGHVPEAELQGPSARAGLKGHLPTMHMPSMKMPKIDLKGPQVDIKGTKVDVKSARGEVTAPNVEVSLPSVEVDFQAPGAKLEADLGLAETEVAGPDGKFKMPKFKMPSFGVSVPGKDLGTSVDVPVPQATGEATLPSLAGEVRAPEASIHLPSADIQLPGGKLEGAVPEGEVTLGELKGKADGARFKGHLPKVQMPSMKMPKIDLKGPQVDIKGPKVDVKGARGEVSAPDVEVSLSSVEVDLQAPGAKLEADLGLGDKEVAARDGKFKMPKFKMPSFGVSVSGKDLGTSVDVPKATGETTLPSLAGEVRAPEASVHLPSADIQLPGGKLEGAVPEGEVTLGELKGKADGARFKGHLPKVQMPSMKMPKIDLKGPQVDIKGPKVDVKGARGEVSAPDVEVSLPSVEVDLQAPGAKLEADLGLAETEVAGPDGKFKMPKFKMPAFGVSGPGKPVEASVDVSLPKVRTDVALPSAQADVKSGDLSVELPSADLDVKTGELGVRLPEGHVPEAELQGPSARAGLKGHLPTMHMPSMKMPKIDLKGPQVDIKGPKVDVKSARGEVTAPNVEVSLPSVEVDLQAPGAKLEADLGLAETEVAGPDGKFKMPKFKMPSFGVSVPGKDLGTSVDVPVPKATGEATLPSLAGEVRAPEASIHLPSADIQLPGGKLEGAVPEGEVTLGELKGKADGARFKGHLPKVQMPSMKMPKIDLKGPQVDIKGPKVDVKGARGEVTAPDVEVSLSSVEVDLQAAGAKLEADLGLGDKEVAARDGKFKMPKFKMPSFGVSVSSKDLGTSVDVPKATGEATLPSLAGEVRAPEASVHLPSADIQLPGGKLEGAVPEGEVTLGELKGKADGARFKGHLPKVQMPSMKMPKIDLKGPQVDIKGPKVDVKGARGEVTAPDVEVSLPSVEVDLQAPGSKLEADLGLAETEVAGPDGKFKMPKFKMPSFGVSGPGKPVEASVDVSLPKVRTDVALPSAQADVKSGDLSVELPSADLDVKTGELGVRLPEGHVPEAELQGPSARAGLKGHLPTMHMPSMKMPKIDLKGPQVDIKGPKVDVKSARGEVTAPNVEVSLPSVEVDIQAPGAKLEADLGLAETEVAGPDGKFKMPKFKMPSFGVSVPGKDLGTSVDVPVPKATGEATLPSLAGEVRAPEASIHLPSADIQLPGGKLEGAVPEGEVTLGELKGKADGARFKGHLPKVQMPSMKMPKIDLKGPQVDIKGPKVDVKGARGEVSAPDVEVSLSSVEVDLQAPGAKLEADLGLGDKEVAARDGKFKMPKFKMPSFGVSVSGKDLGTSVDVPKATGETTLPSLAGEVRAPEASVHLPSADIQLPGGKLEGAVPEGEVTLGELKGKADGARFKGHLPKVQMPSMKMPKIDLKGPQVDIKGPKVDVKGARGEVSAPDVEVSLPSVEVDIQAPDAKLEGDLGLAGTEVAGPDGKFKMPKFKMPSFGVSGPGKPVEASVDVSLPKVRTDVSLPSAQADVKSGDLGVELPSADLDVKTGELGVRLPEGHMPEAELQGTSARAGLKGHLPTMHMPSIKMPKIDVKGPQVDIKGPKVDVKGARGEVTAPNVEVSLPSVEVDLQAPGAKLEADLGLVETEVAGPDGKFKMPKFKMPSFGVSGPGKPVEASVDVSLPKVRTDVALPSAQADVKSGDLSVELPSADLDVKTGELGVRLPEGHVPEAELQGPSARAGLKGHLPTMHMPSMKMPKIDLKGPQVDIKGPKVDVKSARGEVTAPNVEVSLPSVEVDIQAPGAKLEADLGLAETEVAGPDGKFKMPKFKMPSFGVSVPGKDLGTSVDVPVPKATGEATLPSLAGEVRAPEASIHLPSADIQLPGGKLEGAVPEGEVTLGELKGKADGARFKGHLPKVQMPSMKMPKIDLKGPQVDIKGPKVDVKGARGEVSAPDVEVSLSSVEVDLQAPGAKLEADLGLGDKEVAARDGKFKMPKFKMPSFGVSVSGKDLGTSVDVPKATGETTLPSLAGEVRAPEASVHLPSADIQLPGGKLEGAVPEGEVTLGELKGKADGARFKGHLPKVQMPSMKMPKIDLKGPQVDIKGPKVDVKGARGEVSAPDVEVSLSSVEVDLQAPGAKLEADLGLGDKEVAARDGKFKMPKFKMPSFDVSVSGKDLGTSVDVPKATGETTLPSLAGEVRAPEASVHLPSADIQLPGGKLEGAVPEGEVTLGELKGKADGARFKGHLPKVQMPSMKMPKIDLKGPQVDIKGPKVDVKGARGEVSAPDVEVSLPSVEVDIQAPDAKLEGDLGLAGSEVAGPDGKFKMPKFKMPSFGVSGPGKPVEASVDVSLPKVRTDVSLPSAQADVKSGDLNIELPSADLDVNTGELGVRLPEGHMPEAELQGTSARAGLKGHLPTMHMPSIKMPKIDVKGPQVDIKGPKVDVKGARGEVTAPDVEVSLPSVEVDLQAPGAKLEADLGLGDKEVAARDGKFKMPKFKKPSFGVSLSGKDLGTSVDVPKATGEATLPSLAGEVRAPEASVHLPSADIQLPGGKLEGAVPEGEVTLGELKGKADGARLKCHLPKVQMPSMKMPKIDLKGPQVDIKGPKVDVKGTRGEVTVPDVEVSLPSVEVDIQDSGAKLEADLGPAEMEVAGPDGKFKMPKFKMPSFGASGPGKPVEASVDVSLPKVRTDVSLSSAQADVKSGYLSVELPSADLNVKIGELGMRLLEGNVPEAELQGPSARAGLKGHLPTMHMPSMKMPKIDLKGPQVDIKGPKVDVKGARGDVTAPDMEVSLPSVAVDIQAPDAKLEADLGLGDKEVAARDGKFKMPKFRKQSFGVSLSGKDLGTSVDVPKATGEATLPSLAGEVRAPEASVHLPSADIQLPGGKLEGAVPEGEVTLGELKGKADGARFKGHLPKVQMPSMKMPKIDLKGPQVDIKGPKVDVKGARGEVTAPDVEVSLPSMEVDLQAPGAKLEADLGLGDKEVAARDGKFKMPKFKMPSFGVSVPGKDLGTSVDVPVPKATGEATLPSLAGEVRAPEASVHLPSADIQLPGGKLEGAVPEGEVTLGELKGKADGARFKCHLPKVQMPSMKMPKIDLKGPQVDIKGPKVDVKGARGEVTAPDVEVSLPSVEVDIQAPGAKLEADLGLAEMEVAGPDGKFKMPKFKMPSFGASGPGKPVEASVDVSLPKVRTDVSLSSAQADVKSGDLSVELPSADLNVKTGELGMRLLEGHVPDAELQGPSARAGLKGHLPTMHMPTIKMPKIDLKGPQVDIKGPKVDVKGARGEVTAPDVEVSLPSVEVELQAPGAKLEADLGLGDKEVAARDGKFKMPKFKMPSFGVSVSSKDLGTSVDVPKATGEATLPSLAGEVRAPEASVHLPSADIQLPGGKLEGAIPEGEVTLGELKGKADGARFKGHLPKVQMPSMKMPKIDLKGPQVDIKGPKVDVKGARGEVSAPDLEVSLPSVEVDIQAPDAKLEADLGLAEKESSGKSSKFQMPKVSIPFSRPPSGKDFSFSAVHSGSYVAGRVSAASDVDPSDLHAFIPDDGGASSGDKSGEKSKMKKPHFKIPKVFSPPGKSVHGLVALDVGPGAVVPGPASSPAGGVCAASGEPGAVGLQSVQFSRLSWPGSSSRLDISGPQAESSAITSCEGITLTKFQVTVPRATLSPELPQETLSESKGGVPFSSAARAADLPSWESVPVSQPDSHPGPVDPMVYVPYGHVTFPKFHRPKFRFLVSEAAEAEGESCAVAGALAPVPVLDSEEATVCPSSGRQLPSAGASVFQGTEGATGSPRIPTVASGAGPAEDADRDGKGSPLKMPKLRLPSFRRSPKKGAEPKGDPGHSLSAGAGEPVALVPEVEAHVAAAPEQDGDKGRVKSTGFAMPKLALSKMKASKEGVGSAAQAASHATEGAGSEGATQGTGVTPGFPEGTGANLPLAQGHDLGPSRVQVEVSPSPGDLPLPKHGLSLEDDSNGHGLWDSSTSQPPGEDPLQASRGALEPAAPTGRSPHGQSGAGAVPAASQDSWFRMPSFRLPSFWRSSKERGGGPDTLREGEAPATVASPGVCAPGSEVGAAVSLPPPEAEAAAEADSEGSQLHLPPPLARRAPADPPTSEARLCPGEGSLPLQTPRDRLSETQASPEETGKAPARWAGGTEQGPSSPGRPLRLLASRTEVPAQVSLVEVVQFREDPVLTVKFPALKVPRFTFPAPGPSSEADVCVLAAALREAWCPGSSLELAPHTESPGVWGPSILKADAGAPGQQPVAPDLSEDAPPISKVRVHIQGTRVESREVTIHSRVTAESAGLSGPQVFSTQIVRESEIPASEVQTPAYGFSLLKGKVVERALWAPAHVVTQDHQPPLDSVHAASKQAALEADPVPGGALQPDTGEPFEMISSICAPRPQIHTSEVCSGPRSADSCSDEEPAEILEIPPEDGREDDGAAGEKPGVSRSSGRFRFWLPSIGFSSAAEDTGAGPAGAVQTPVPVQTQPEARPEAELPRKPEKAGWFRFPRLGFSSAPSKKSDSTRDQEDEAGLAEPGLQEEAVTFFDARESFSTEEKEDEKRAEAGGGGGRPGPSSMVTSAARTELARLELGTEASATPAPRPLAQ